MKKMFLLLLVITLGVTTLPAASSAESTKREIEVIIAGNKVRFPDAKPFMDSNNRTLVPVRFVAENLGAKVAWHEDLQRVDIALDGSYISLTIGEKKALVNGEEVTFDTAAVMQNSRTYVPLRFVSEALGETVEWDGASSFVYIGEKVFLTPEEKGIEPKSLDLVRDMFTDAEYLLTSVDGSAKEYFYDLTMDDLPIRIDDHIYYDFKQFEMGGYAGVKFRSEGRSNGGTPIFYVTKTFQPRYRYAVKTLKETHNDGSITAAFRVVESRDYDLHGDKNYKSFTLKEVEYIGIRDLSKILVLIQNPFKQ